jgi:hypothetical protein
VKRRLIPRAGLAILMLLAAAPGSATGLQAPPPNVSIPVFDTGLPDDAGSYAEIGVFPQIREIEARFLPYALRRALADSGDWGVVRVVQHDDVIEELVVHGEILRSDGRLLAIRIRAVDASGETWLDDSFAAVPTAGATDPAYGRLFADVATRLHEALAGQSGDRLRSVRELALLRYGARLAPRTFGQYLDGPDNARYRIRRLPASNDPMLDRITRIRQAENVIVDAGDDKYESLHEDVDSVYAAWQEFSRKSLEYEADDDRRMADTTTPAPRGSYEALLHAYENYQFTRFTAEERDSMAAAFANEVRPVLRRLNGRLGTYDAWLEGKYREWNRLLEELNVLETRVED